MCIIESQHICNIIISKGNKNFLGKNHSEESKKRMSESAKLRWIKKSPECHGTAKQYRRGCRCLDCADANRKYFRAYISSRKTTAG